MTPARFHVPGAASGARMLLPEASAHHARDVLRLHAGHEVRAFDGEGAEFDAVLEEVSRRRVRVRIGAQVQARAESPLHLVLFVSALRGDRMELILQKAVELGVTEIRPYVGIRTDAAARPALRGSRQERWERVVSGAAEQCGRAHVPAVAPTTTFGDAVAAPDIATRLLLSERGDTEPLAGLAAPRSPTALLVGPPGGFEDSELEQAGRCGWRFVGLGPRILRSETAAIAAVAVLQARFGDLK